MNISKTSYIILYDRKILQPPPFIPVTIDENPLIKLKAKRVLGNIIDEELPLHINKPILTMFN